ncbi:MAG TPA: acyl-CoA reductase, partial [Chitinophagaceae bacterium]|nr:acyl-CoA reductase [Chitinophagaceae bacterium]
MMELQERIQLISEIGKHLGSVDANWLTAKERASRENPWFIPEFIDHAVTQICQQFLQAAALAAWAKQYGLPAATPSPKTVGLVTAGNIPLVGFHDLLCIFISGHKALIKPSSKDSILLKYIVNKMSELDARVNDLIQFQEQLKNCDAYIATGGNNTSRYFSYYFGKYP